MFNNIFLHCLVHVYTIFADTFSESYPHYVSRYFHSMYEDMFTQRQPVDGIFLKCLNPYSLKIDKIVLLVEDG